MDDRRLVGIDLGITSAHTVRVLDGGGTTVRRKAVPTVASLTEVERAALAGRRPGLAWRWWWSRPGRRGCRSRCSLVPAGTPCTGSAPPRPTTCGGCGRGTPRQAASTPTPWRGCRWSTRRVAPAAAAGCARGGAGPPRARDRSAHPPGRHPQAAPQDLVGQLLPASPLTGELGKADLAVLERYGTPQTLAAGPIRLARLIQGTSHGQQGAARAAQWLAAAQAALALYGDHPAVAVADLAAEVQTEVRLRRRHRPPDVFRAAGAGLSISGAPGRTRTCNLLPGPVVTLDVDAEAWLWAGSSSSCSLAYSSSGVISGSARTSNGWPTDTNPTVAHWTDGAGRPG
jgi:hypothetical protein